MWNVILFKFAVLCISLFLLQACEPLEESKILISQRYLDNEDGTVTDVQNKLTWQRCSVGQQWSGTNCEGDAETFNLEDASLLEKDGWRLPTIEELDTIVYCASGQRNVTNSDAKNYKNGFCDAPIEPPSINKDVFPSTPSSRFWSSTPHLEYGNNAWCIAFDSGWVYVTKASNEGYVRLVRK